jgi:hypothetical protein
MDKQKIDFVKEIDSAKPDGWSLSIMCFAILFVITRTYISNDFLWVLVFLILFGAVGCFILFPYAVPTERFLFNLKPLFLRRCIIVIIKGFAFLIAVFAGLNALALRA